MANFEINSIESYQPALNYRKSGRIGVLDGRNFAWDAAGVHSAFASRLVSADFSLGSAPDVAQDLTYTDETHVVVGDNIYRWVEASFYNPVGTWEVIATLVKDIYADVLQVPYAKRHWSHAYLKNANYACNFNYGLYRVTQGDTPLYERMQDEGILGLPDDPILAICETNGRLVLLTDNVVYWSGQNAPEYYVPEIGGPGYIVINERIGGTPFAITAIATGAIIWTTSGALILEFIGGNSVYRAYPINTDSLPLGGYAITPLPDNTYVLCSRLGLFQVSNANQPQVITPLFNEFLREYLRTRSTHQVHLWYSINDNRLYLATRSKDSVFTQTFCLDVALDKWGIFNTHHIGMFNYGVLRGQIAYADSNGIASYLLPLNEYAKDKEDPANPGTYIDLDSEIIIGYIRSPDLVPHADTVQELQEIRVYREIEFLTETEENVDEGLVVDWAMATSYDEGLISAIDGDTVLFDEGERVDQNLWTDYGLEVLTDLLHFYDPVANVESNTFYPEIVHKGVDADLWVTIAPSSYHRLKFTAQEHGQFYRVNGLDLTMRYEGNVS